MVMQNEAARDTPSRQRESAGETHNLSLLRSMARLIADRARVHRVQLRRLEQPVRSWIVR
jgi:hypothetical protein